MYKSNKSNQIGRPLAMGREVVTVMKQRTRTKKTKTPAVRRNGYVLKVTDKVIEWQEEAEAEGKGLADEIFERLLPRFGWSQTEKGNLEHVGMESPEDAA